MLKVVILSIFSMFIVSCASTDIVDNVGEDLNQDPILYIDLTLDNKKDLLKEYWILIKRQDPRYPSSAAREGLSGCVYITFGIKENGRLGGVKITKSYPQGIFDEYAVEALNKWRWSATAKNIDKLPVLTTVQLDFTVSGSRNKTEAQKQCVNQEALGEITS